MDLGPKYEGWVEGQDEAREEIAGLHKEIERLRAHLQATNNNWPLVIDERDKLRKALEQVVWDVANVNTSSTVVNNIGIRAREALKGDTTPAR